TWRPYADGYWAYTDDGWTWISYEDFGWATYHYGRWDFRADFGWYWVPQTQWAPAWVAWRSGGDYVGWAPLPPSARYEDGRARVEVNAGLIAPSSFVFVEQRHFMDNHRPATVIVNNTTIVNKTVNITNIKVVNKTIINEGPATADIGRATGRDIRPATVAELRRAVEQPVAVRRPVPPPVKPVTRPAVPPQNPPTATRPAPPPRPATGLPPAPPQAPERKAVLPRQPQPAENATAPRPVPAAPKTVEIPARKPSAPVEPKPEAGGGKFIVPEPTKQPPVERRPVPEPVKPAAPRSEPNGSRPVAPEAAKPAPAKPKPSTPEKPESRSSTNEVRRTPGQP
ncbi:MAG: DUF6600 domain-containing protein, partial [Bryobacteraceae bacterium]